MNNNMPTSNVMKDEFNWTVPVESVPLPSNGTIYNPDSTLYNRETVQIKAMTAQEEDILTSQAYIKDGSVVPNLIRSCLVDKTIDVDDLITGDRNALMVAIRITGYGNIYKVGYTCGNCSHQEKIDIDLSSLPIRRLEEQPIIEGKNLFSYVLPVTKKTIHYKYITGHDEKEEDMKRKRLDKLGIQMGGNVTNFLESIIVSVDGVEDKNKIKHFVANMPALDSRKLRLHVRNSEPGIDMKWEYQCSNCSAQNAINIPITSEFFWPST